MNNLKTSPISMYRHDIDALKMQFLTNKVFPVSLCSFGKDSSSSNSIALMAWTEAIEISPILRKLPFIIINNNTRQENPLKDAYVKKEIASIRAFAKAKNFKIAIIQPKPNFVSSWAGKVLSGNMANFRADTTSGRQCSVLWKIEPSDRELAKWKKIAHSMGYKLLRILGSRYSESDIRKANLDKVNAKPQEISVYRGDAFYYPVYNWSLENVWDYLMFADSNPQSSAPAFKDGFYGTVEFYNEMNTSECSADSLDKSGCAGSRDGCVFCFASLDENLDAELANNNPHIADLMQLRRFMLLNETNYNNRNFLSAVEDNGFIHYTPTCLSGKYLELLLGISLTIQIREEERAAQVKELVNKGQFISVNGKQPLSEPQFKVIDTDELLYINLNWMTRGLSLETNKALKIYRDIYFNGLRVEFPSDFRTDNAVTNKFQEKGTMYVGKEQYASEVVNNIPFGSNRSWCADVETGDRILADKLSLDKICSIDKADFTTAINYLFQSKLLQPPKSQKNFLMKKISRGLGAYKSGANVQSWRGGDIYNS